MRNVLCVCVFVIGLNLYICLSPVWMGGGVGGKRLHCKHHPKMVEETPPPLMLYNVCFLFVPFSKKLRQTQRGHSFFFIEPSLSFTSLEESCVGYATTNLK